MVLIICDKIFGTFQKEDDDEPVKYSLTKAVEDRSPWNMIVYEWQDLWGCSSTRFEFFCTIEIDFILRIGGMTAWERPVKYIRRS